MGKSLLESLKVSRMAMAMMMPVAIAAVSCGSKEEVQKGFPANFGSLDDSGRVAYVMAHAEPDSVARFICDAALGKTAGARIDTLAIAAAYAYEHYNDSALIAFSREFDDYSSNLPLDEKMRIYQMAGNVNPNGLGYELGLEYVAHIREKRMTVDEVKKEIEAFRMACGSDSSTYKRFMKGFRTVLRIDHGMDLDENVYKTFIEE